MKKIYRKTNKGFSILEVLFAVVILSFALSTIFILLNSMFKVVGKVKTISLEIDETPLVFSSLSPLLHYKNIKNYTSEIFTLPHYTTSQKYTGNPCNNFKTLYIGIHDTDKSLFNKKYFSNIIYIPLKKNNKDTNELQT